MSSQAPHHPEPIRISPSILRASAGKRLAAVGIIIMALWVALFWAMV
jgi:hypothetical protein